MDRSICLLDQILEMAKEQAKDLDEYNIKRHKAMRTIGKNAVVFHLELLKELILEESKFQSQVTLGGKQLEVSLGEEK